MLSWDPVNNHCWVKVEIRPSPVITIAGEIDLAAAGPLDELFDGLHGRARDRLQVDLSQVTFADASCLRVLLAARQRTLTAGAAMRLVLPSRPVRELLRLAGLDQHFDLVLLDPKPPSPLVYTQVLANLDDTLRRAMTMLHAARGTAQIADAKTGWLRLVSSPGFGPPFTDFFETVHTGSTSACERAASSGHPFAIQDVSTSSVFDRTPASEVMERADVAAVASVPVLTSTRLPVGVVSVHRSKPHAWSALELPRLETLARETSSRLAEAG